MGLLAVKLAVTPLLMALVTLVNRRFGAAAGGIVAGLPLTSGPISLYLALEQGLPFAGAAAHGSLVGVGAVLASYLAYLRASRRCSVPLSCLAGFAGFALWALAAGRIGSDAALILVDLSLTGLLLALTRGARTGIRPARLLPWDLPTRIAVSTGLVVLVTLSAPLLGPAVSGLLAPVPVIAWPLIVFVHAQSGRDAASATIRGTVSGAVGLCAFNLAVIRLAPTEGIAPTYAVALSLSLAVSLASVGLIYRRRR
ncbi:hypothetical protein ASG52_03860 [Methylobacterium sp. Leaf456]|uniref:hypothetical protein n=1 Tax=Methylobacterium sp. Leaf456 TaxID=1736382 RepID=UPI0006F46606|nr:hypothetical protein [Methylobacterium sp. Leaf456]KQT57204.1 hypothetical protein ASG52_03860 [Methylobacterium sp. Leaf456]